jgi:hypothetical protein
MRRPLPGCNGRHGAGGADNSIQSITSTQQAGAEVVRIEMAAPLAAVPNGFAVQTPPRVALDLPAVGNALGKSVVDINQGNLRSVAIAQAGDRTRLVLNLRQSSSYRRRTAGQGAGGGAGEQRRTRHGRQYRGAGALCRRAEPRPTAPA